MKIFFWKSHPLRKHLIFLSFFRKKLKSEYSDYINAPLVIEIILLDINLKSENGLAIGETLKKRVPQIPLVFLTGFDLAEYRTQAKKLHAEGFLNKNIHPTKLLEKLKTIIENGPIAIENEKGF